MSAMSCLEGRELGKGGMGQVFEIVDADGSRLAAKCVRPDLTLKPTCKSFLGTAPVRRDPHPMHQRFDDECLHAGALSGDPLFPTVIEVRRNVRFHLNTMGPWQEEVADQLLIMELCGPRTLRGLLRDGGKLDTGKTAKIGAQAALALHRLSLLGMTHRDVKHDNLTVNSDEGDGLKLLDLGLARNRRRPPAEDHIPRIGSPSYMSPESYFGVRDTPESDLFSLGIVMMECLKADRVFRLEDYREWIDRYGETPYFPEFDNMGYRVSTYAYKHFGMSSKECLELEKMLHFEPLEKYTLWLNGDPEYIRRILAERIERAKAIIKPHAKQGFNHLCGTHMRLETYHDSVGSVQLRKFLDQQLGALQCDDSLKAILAQLVSLDFTKRTRNGYVLARDLAKIAVKHDPNLRLKEPFYTLVGRCTSVSVEDESVSHKA